MKLNHVNVAHYVKNLRIIRLSGNFAQRSQASNFFQSGLSYVTAPECATTTQILNAFDHFCDYLRRHGELCVCVEKELGESHGKLHFHIMVNNFIRIYRKLEVEKGV